jgi:release factor glutamine methyltransferase
MSSSIRTYFSDCVFDNCVNVYEPAEDSFLFAENLQITKGARVLDIGTGSGILGIIASKRASSVLAVDVNPYAVRCAKQNASSNKVLKKMAFLRGDLFTPFSATAKFDVILFNAPYLPSEVGEGESWLERAWAGGPTGRQIIDRFIAQAPEHLERAGEILLMQSNLANAEETVGRLQALKLEVEIIAQKKLPFFETLVLLKARSASS